MAQGDIIALVFTGLVAFLGGVSVIFTFIKKWLIEPQIEHTNVQSMTNKQLAKLANQMQHQNELTEVKLLAINKDIDNVSWKVDKSFEVLDGRLVKVEEVTFVKSNSQ